MSIMMTMMMNDLHYCTVTYNMRIWTTVLHSEL